ncbi:MAG: DUF1127 domain-containing protein, partial [Gammaproteobacteria bacterium]|nr:DUF1127 domain-containing protein [Gammaproteobacteria bacterium]
MNARKNQASEMSWIGQPGVHRRVSLTLRGGLPGDALPPMYYETDAVDYYQRKGRRLQARAVAQGLRGAARWLASGIGAALRGARERHRLRVAERQLGALDDRLLRDIGLTRGDIPAVVRGTLAGTFRPTVPVADIAAAGARPAAAA